MDPFADIFVVSTIIGGAAAYLVVRWWRQRKAKTPLCGGGCGCSVAKKLK